MKLFHIFLCREKRADGMPCDWPLRVREGRVPRGADGKRVQEIEEFCKRCRRQGRTVEGEKSVLHFIRRENEDRRIVEDLLLARMR